MAEITVILPSYNVADYIGECLESVVTQTFQNMEILCIDAGSTDGTLEIIKNYMRADGRIRLYLSDKKSFGYPMIDKEVSGCVYGARRYMDKLLQMKVKADQQKKHRTMQRRKAKRNVYRWQCKILIAETDR